MGSNRPLARLLLESLAVVASILLAFAIDAWWDQRVERSQRREVMVALLQQAQQNQARLDSMVAYHEYARDATEVLLEAAAESMIPPDSMDVVLFGIAGWPYPSFDRAAVDVAFEGAASLLGDDAIARDVTVWRRMLDQAQEHEAVLQHTIRDVLWPYLRRHGSLPQIASAAESQMPGDPGYTSATPFRRRIDHTALLRENEFLGILQEEKWSHEDALYFYSNRLRPTLEAVVMVLQAEMPADTPGIQRTGRRDKGIQ